MELEWKQSIRIPDGNHVGEIKKIENRTEPYEYTDIMIKLDDVDDIEMKYGCPTVLSENSKLGRLMQLFGASIEVGKKLNIDNFLIGKRVKCVTITKKNQKSGKEFSEIVEDSLKPEVEIQNV